MTEHGFDRAARLIKEARSNAEVTLEQAERANHELGRALAGSPDAAGQLGRAAAASSNAADKAAEYAQAVLNDPHASEAIRKTFDGTAETVEVDWQAAPLDPSKVKAGDTAEIRSGKTVVGGVVTRTEFQPRGVILWFEKVPNGYWVDDADDPEPFRLTDHQPAPKPEWKPGTTGTGTTPIGTDERVMRTTGYGPQGPVWVDAHNNRLHESEVTHFVPDEPRPLPTRDELYRVFNEHPGDWKASLLGVLAHLGIEAL